MVKIIIDPTIFGEAFLHQRGTANRFLKKLNGSNSVEVLWSEQIYSETESLLAQIGASIDFVLLVLNLFFEGNRLKNPKARLNHSADWLLHILTCAYESHADLIISNDQDLLTLNNIGGTAIVDPGSAEKILSLPSGYKYSKNYSAINYRETVKIN